MVSKIRWHRVPEVWAFVLMIIALTVTGEAIQQNNLHSTWNLPIGLSMFMAIYLWAEYKPALGRRG